jgi:hypothetical protein
MTVCKKNLKNHHTNFLAAAHGMGWHGHPEKLSLWREGGGPAQSGKVSVIDQGNAKEISP